MFYSFKTVIRNLFLATLNTSSCIYCSVPDCLSCLPSHLLLLKLSINWAIYLHFASLTALNWREESFLLNQLFLKQITNSKHETRKSLLKRPKIGHWKKNDRKDTEGKVVWDFKNSLQFSIEMKKRENLRQSQVERWLRSGMRQRYCQGKTGGCLSNRNRG